ncbi:deoxyribodipyrimidine photo-lyase [Deinococcus ruber]|uniref:Deoxyribodipyrimidine photo-lyase n=1 Tax=Deinococcus ruber TaxID=1848197 RepID=A0A918KX79_9DEIO|nr:deoxyribodipyrimidine photo-lyase [Deinococcus ruber]GGR38850.1 deoxyribodipyrimidine photo-lyase [Deinococcus ruber]
MFSPVQPERLSALRPGDPRPGQYVLYWMQASVRGAGNHALEHALSQANALGLPLLTVFGLTPTYPSANARHYQFLLEGLAAAAATLQQRGLSFRIGLTPHHGPPQAPLALAEQAALLITDRGYLRTSRTWRQWLSEQLTLHHPDLPFLQVEAEAVVPVHSASSKQEYAARTLRPKLRRLLPTFLVPLLEGHPQHTLDAVPSPPALTWLDVTTLDDPAALIRTFGVEGVPPVAAYRGGLTEARKRLRVFLQRLERYEADRNDPTVDDSSQLSAYLHYGHISPVEIALALQDTSGAGVEAYLDELIVQRELNFNFCEYREDYDRYSAVPAWAQATLKEHQQDLRTYIYARAELEAATTHDVYWNAAQREMTQTGRMSNYLRMYWGKKVLEWTPDPADAFDTLVYLNDKYELDGRDPNSYGNIAWIFGLHDRPWIRRPIFGMVRYMAASGLKQKFDIKAYVRKWGDAGS